MIFTGFALYAQGLGEGSWADSAFGWVIPLMGGSAAVRSWHLFGLWVMLVFAIIHIYMAVRSDAISHESSVSTMIGGWRMFRCDQASARLDSDHRTLALAVGNLLWADEGFGVRAIEVLMVSRRHFSALAQRGRMT